MSKLGLTRKQLKTMVPAAPGFSKKAAIDLIPPRRKPLLPPRPVPRPRRARRRRW